MFWYDADGNLTNDGRWVYTWDAENRLVKVESVGTSPAASKRTVEWVYDPRGRRIQQTTYDLSSGSAVATENLKFAYDGWRCIAELNATNNALLRYYAWGLDLSGTMDEAGLPRQSTATAGGVGGLLWMRSGPAVYFCQYDGNGNVVGLVQGNGAQVAVYEYDPFGRTLRTTGSQAKNNPFRFSTKRCDRTTDFVLYEYRVYNPSTGRWPNRDPIAERGGLNLYGFVGNDPADYVDELGLKYGNPVSGPNGPVGPAYPYDPNPWAPRDPTTSSYSVSGESMLESVRRIIPKVEGSFSPISWTFLWVPYPGGNWKVEASASGAVKKCCSKNGMSGLIAEVSVTVQT